MKNTTLFLFFFSLQTIIKSDTQFSIKNDCPFTVWVGIQSNEGSKSDPHYQLPHNGGWELPSGQASDISLPSDLKGARIWGRTGCEQACCPFEWRQLPSPIGAG